LVEVFVSGAIDKAAFDKEHRRLRDHADETARQLRKVESLALSGQRIIASTCAVERLYKQYKNKLKNASDEQKREIFQTFIKAVVVRDDCLELEVNLPPASGFAGQELKLLSPKPTPSLFIRTRALPISELFRKLGMEKNFKNFETKKLAG
jgi:hypothetical protein